MPASASQCEAAAVASGQVLDPDPPLGGCTGYAGSGSDSLLEKRERIRGLLLTSVAAGTTKKPAVEQDVAGAHPRHSLFRHRAYQPFGTRSSRRTPSHRRLELALALVFHFALVVVVRRGKLICRVVLNNSG